MKKLYALILIALILSIFSSFAFPILLDQQGVLRNSTTNQRIDGTFNFNVTLYNLSNNAAVYSENKTLTTSAGIWNYVVGTTTPVTRHIFKDDLYMKARVAEELMSMVNLTAVPYAFYCLFSNETSNVDSEDIIDVDDEDVESDLNTYVDIAGDIMVGHLNMSGSDILNVTNIMTRKINTTNLTFENGVVFTNTSSIYYKTNANTYDLMPKNQLIMVNGTCPDGYAEFLQLRGRVPVGHNSTNTDFDVLGEMAGEQDHVLIDAELSSHDHGSQGGSGSVTFHGIGVGAAVNAVSGIFSGAALQSNIYHTNAGTAGANSYAQFDLDTTHTHTAVGSDDAHENLQPYRVVTFCLRK